MFSQTCLGTVLLLNVLAAPAPLTPGLRWQLKEGDVVYHQSESSVQQNMTIMGMKVDQKQELATLTRYVVKRKNADGSLVRCEHSAVFDEVAEMRIPLLTNWRL